MTLLLWALRNWMNAPSALAGTFTILARYTLARGVDYSCMCVLYETSTLLSSSGFFIITMSSPFSCVKTLIFSFSSLCLLLVGHRNSCCSWGCSWRRKLSTNYSLSFYLAAAISSTTHGLNSFSKSSLIMLRYLPSTISSFIASPASPEGGC